MPKKKEIKRIVVIGGTRGIGLETVKALVKKDHEVVAFSRNALDLQFEDKNLTKIAGNATNQEDVNLLIKNADAVVQTLGVPLSLNLITGPIDLFSTATRVLVSSMKSNNVKRLVAVTGFGAGDSEEKIHCLQKVPFNIIFGHAYRDKSIQEECIKRSDLNWTIVRPGVLTNLPFRENYSIRVNKEDWKNGFISRAAVAHYITQSLYDSKTYGITPVLAN